MHTSVTFVATMAVLTSVSAIPFHKRASCDTIVPVVDTSAPMQLYYAPRTAQVDTDGCDVQTAVNAGPVTYLDVEQPDGPATRGQRYLTASSSQDEATFVSVKGGYIQVSLPIPLNEPPANAIWSSINDPIFPDDGSNSGGEVWFTTANEGADGGLNVSPVSGALYLFQEDTPDLEPDYAIWKVCEAPEGPYLAFKGESTTTCEDVYLVGCNKGNCPAATPA